MFTSQVLEIAIGPVLRLPVASSLASVAREFIESNLKTGAVQLERGMRLLLDDPIGMQTTATLSGQPALSTIDARSSGDHFTKRPWRKPWRRSSDGRPSSLASSRALSWALSAKWDCGRAIALALLPANC